MVVKAYTQCERFLMYLNSGSPIPLYKRENGRYIEMVKVTLSDYRVVIPIGLTVESFAPYSSMCKELPQILPILGCYPFVSISVDDLFVLRRLFEDIGQRLHYLEVRQAVAGIKGIRLYDEIDHIGAYISQNRYDIEFQKARPNETDILIVTDANKIVDDFFMSPNFGITSPPTQKIPAIVAQLLKELNRTKPDGWLRIDSQIRSFDRNVQDQLAFMLENECVNLREQPSGSFLLGKESSLLFFLQTEIHLIDYKDIRHKSEDEMLAIGPQSVDVILITLRIDGGFGNIDIIKTDTHLNNDIEFGSLL